MERNELLAQYDRFISQLRIEVNQMFWLYNFFFVADGALLGWLLAGESEKQYLILAIFTGLVFSIYWLYMMNQKDKARNSWLVRIKEVEEKLIFEKELWMWLPEGYTFSNPKIEMPKKGLWRKLFWLPGGFIAIWLLILIRSIYCYL